MWRCRQLDGSLDALIERKAKALATEIVLRTSNSMKLEDQENSMYRIEKGHRRADCGHKT